METEMWTSSYTVERLKEELSTIVATPSSTKTDLLEDPCRCEQYGYKIESRKYYHQVYHYLKIGWLKPVPSFLISLSDLSNNMIKQLMVYDILDRKFILKQAVMRLFEDINIQLYHRSVSRVLVVELKE